MRAQPRSRRDVTDCWRRHWPKVVPIDKLSVVITLVLAFVLLHEEVSTKAVAGCVLIGAGTLVMVL